MIDEAATASGEALAFLLVPNRGGESCHGAFRAGKSTAPRAAKASKPTRM